MDSPTNTPASAWRIILRTVLILSALGVLIYAFEHWGEQSMTRLSAYIAELGTVGIVVFVGANALATMFLVPQSVFSVAAGALFGWKFGTLWASFAMTVGALGSFLIARYGVRHWIKERFHENVLFGKMQQLSKRHPLHVISFSRLIPVIPFPVASYLLGVTEVHSVPYALLTWLCMLPETLFLASGGHFLHSGITGRSSIEGAVVLGVAGILLAIIVHRVKKKFLDSEDDV